MGDKDMSPTQILLANSPTARQIAAELRTEGMKCNCDLDNWEPEPETGHSCVCRIHKIATRRRYEFGQGWRS